MNREGEGRKAEAKGRREQPLRAMRKTNPNDDRGQNPKTSFSHWIINVSSWRDPGAITCFYETNPNRKIQKTWWQDIVKNGRREINKTKPNEPKLNPTSKNIRLNPAKSDLMRLDPSESNLIRPNPTESDPTDRIRADKPGQNGPFMTRRNDPRRALTLGCPSGKTRVMRSLTFSFLLAGWLAAIGIVSTARAAAPVNLITNGGFEDGTTGWEPDAKHELVNDPKRAHSGNACLTGEVTRDRQALILRRRVPVKVGFRYHFVFWAKATNETKIVLRVIHPGTDPKAPRTEATRPLVAAWDELPNQWHKYECDVPVSTSGLMELNIITPSSNGAPPGRVWVDDIALYETDLPVSELVSAGAGFNDEATMAQAGDGSLYVVWNSFRDNVDTMQIARYTVADKTFKKLGQWQPLGGKGLYLLGFKAVAAGDKIFVLYAAEVDKKWDIYALPCGADGPGQPIRISSGGGVNVKPMGAWRDGTLGDHKAMP